MKQLLKLPVLAEHFMEHRQLDEHLSLAGFLYMHYTDHDLNDNDQDRDMQLPFKSHDNCGFMNLQFLPAQIETASLHIPPVTIPNVTIYKHSDIQSSYLSAIWQPPKSC